MVTMFWQTQSHKQDRHLPGFLHGDHGADRSSFADEGRFFPKSSAHRTRHRLDIGSLKQSFERLKHPFPFDFHVWIQLRYVTLQQRENLFRRLIRHQPHTHFEFAMARYHRLHSWSVIAAGESMDLKRRRGPNAAHDLGGVLRTECLKSIGLLE